MRKPAAKEHASKEIEAAFCAGSSVEADIPLQIVTQSKTLLNAHSLERQQVRTCGDSARPGRAPVGTPEAAHRLDGLALE